LYIHKTLRLLVLCIMLSDSILLSSSRNIALIAVRAFQRVRHFDVLLPVDDDTIVDYDTIESENTLALASAKRVRINYQLQSQCRLP